MTSSVLLSEDLGAAETLWDRRRRIVSLEIERVALMEFAAHGYSGVTIEQIANAAGITVRTFYRYFANKEDVLIAMPRRVTARLIEAIQNRPADENIIDSFRAVVADNLEASPDDEALALQWSAAFRNSDQLPSQRMPASIINAMVSLVASRLGVDADQGPRPRVIAAAIIGAIDVGLKRWTESGGARDRRATLLECLDILKAMG